MARGQTDLLQVDWSRIPAPQDDGAARHLAGMLLPDVPLPGTEGVEVSLRRLPGRVVVYAYPRTGRPGEKPLVEDWDEIPGARGCTPQSCAFRDHHAELVASGASRVFGLSTQDTAYQQEAAARLRLPFPLLSDASLTLARAAGLPTMSVAGLTLLRRLALVIDDWLVTKVFYPVFPPDRNAMTRPDPEVRRADHGAPHGPSAAISPFCLRTFTLARVLPSRPPVTAPRRVVPGTTYLVSRRCTQREFLLKPSALTNLIFKFVLAVAAARYGVLIHAVCVMSNHLHLVLTDPRANLPDFSRLLDGVVAKALNALHGRWEYFWAPSTYSAVALVSPEDIIEKVAYTLANPASAGLVEHGSEWPGVWSDPRAVGQPGEIIERPAHYFAKDGSMPERQELVFSAPPGFESVEAFRAQVLARVHQLEQAAAAERNATGVSVLGAHRVLKQRHTDRPAPGEPRRVLNPRVASRDKWKRIEALGRLVSFLERHREALMRFCRGERNVVFPRGTYLMRVRFGVACASS